MAALFRKRPQQTPVRTPKHASSQLADSLTFRRSRTLTGSASEQVRSVSEERAQLRSPRLKEHELRTHRRKLGGYLAGSIIVIMAIIALLSQFAGIVTPHIVSVQPVNGQVDTAAYLKVIDDYFWDHPTERFSFARNDTSLAAYLATKAPEVESVSFDQTGITTATADITFRVPVVTWKLGSGTYYVDGNGRAFTKNYFAPPSVTVKDDSGLTEASTGVIVSNRFLESMGRVIALTAQSGINVTGATLPRNTTREIDFNLEGRGYIVKAQLGRDPASQAMDIVNAVRYVDGKGIKPKYLDVRVTSKAAYI